MARLSRLHLLPLILVANLQLSEALGLPSGSATGAPTDFNNTAEASGIMPWPSFGLQFQSWYPFAATFFNEATDQACDEPYQLYVEAYHTPALHRQLLSLCYDVEACLLDNFSPASVADMQSADVVLGLLPSLMSAIGPSIAEISLLSSQRPVLSFLLSMGAPAVSPTRVFEFNDPLVVLGVQNDSKWVVHRFRSWISGIVSATEYLLAMAAVVNMIYASVQLGRNTIVAWACTTTCLPFLWTIVASFIHIIGSTSYAITQRRQRLSNTWKGGTTIVEKIGRAALAEVTICANVETAERSSPGRATVLLNVFAGCCAFVHILFGTIVLSGLQFIGVLDVMNQVLWRYLVSTAICRLILMFEIAGLRNKR